MGFETSTRHPANLTEWFEMWLDRPRSHSGTRLVDFEVVDRGEAYALIETASPSGLRTFHAEIYMASTQRDRIVRTVFGHSVLLERDRPEAHRCPERIMSRLSPTTEMDTLLWRRKVALWKQIMDRRVVSDGEIVRFDHPVVEHEGTGYDTFRTVVEDGDVFFEALNTMTGDVDAVCEIPNWRQLRFDAIGDEDVIRVVPFRR